MPIDIIHPIAEKYADDHTTSDEDVLQMILEETLQTHPQAHMVSGHTQGRFLSFISKIVRPKYILEIGTFTGYSALCLSEGLIDGGEMHTIEIREEDAAIAKKNFKKANRENSIVLHTGNAKEIISTLAFSWDLVFIDADKTGYVDYYELILPHLSEKGIIIADNVLFHGQVLDEKIKGKNAQAIDNFNKHVANDDRVEQVMLTLRDGLLLIKKKSG